MFIWHLRLSPEGLQDKPGLNNLHKEKKERNLPSWLLLVPGFLFGKIHPI
jgi:hypothetical protein